MTSVKQFKQENQRHNIYKKKRVTRNTYEPHQQTTTTEQQAPNIGQVEINVAGLNIHVSLKARLV